MDNKEEIKIHFFNEIRNKNNEIEKLKQETKDLEQENKILIEECNEIKNLSKLLQSGLMDIKDGKMKDEKILIHEETLQKVMKIVNKDKLKQFKFMSNILKEKFKYKYEKKRSITQRLKSKVWIKYIENGRESRIGKCYCCQTREIYSDDYQCGHVVSENDGGTEIIENLRPICESCNDSMGTENMVDFIIKHELWN